MGDFPGQNLDKGALTGAGLANKKHEVTLLDLKRNIFQTGDIASVIDLDVLELNIRWLIRIQMC